MSLKLGLDGAMIPRKVKRVFDGRAEARVDARSQTAVLDFRGRKNVVRLVNIAPSGAMVIFSTTPHIGEEVRLQLIDRAPICGRVQWARDGRIGVSFTTALE